MKLCTSRSSRAVKWPTFDHSRVGKRSLTDTEMSFGDELNSSKLAVGVEKYVLDN